eukprot:CAMPEP_0174350124 /NCGR_PEP_ID=MMETSP0811_2-20130205/7116_1 /TAXON_ID=73025 ORGANISM="Eutreptiella gymnastica-like, Strain CCMP1594" /NCGR_SAMPLE_ID=MMETSP0811_2 /ASSEMBLY_ACC=CAM_ASM_000667 /LENGTH=714 /DNA_ID=CAMNT_0015478153 /DNA_START=2393 /DNA_END=4537 /DNA_ORIENTATION=-
MGCKRNVWQTAWVWRWCQRGLFIWLKTKRKTSCAFGATLSWETDGKSQTVGSEYPKAGGGGGGGGLQCNACVWVHVGLCVPTSGMCAACPVVRFGDVHASLLRPCAFAGATEGQGRSGIGGQPATEQHPRSACSRQSSVFAVQIVHSIKPRPAGARRPAQGRAVPWGPSARQHPPNFRAARRSRRRPSAAVVGGPVQGRRLQHLAGVDRDVGGRVGVLAHQLLLHVGPLLLHARDEGFPVGDEVVVCDEADVDGGPVRQDADAHPQVAGGRHPEPGLVNHMPAEGVGLLGPVDVGHHRGAADGEVVDDQVHGAVRQPREGPHQEHPEVGLEPELHEPHADVEVGQALLRRGEVDGEGLEDEGELVVQDDGAVQAAAHVDGEADAEGHLLRVQAAGLEVAPEGPGQQRADGVVDGDGLALQLPDGLDLVHLELHAGRGQDGLLVPKIRALEGGVGVAGHQEHLEDPGHRDDQLHDDEAHEVVHFGQERLGRRVVRVELRDFGFQGAAGGLGVAVADLVEPHPDAGPVPDNVVEAEEELGAPALDVVQDDDLELPPVFGELRRDLFVDEVMQAVLRGLVQDVQFDVVLDVEVLHGHPRPFPAAEQELVEGPDPRPPRRQCAQAPPQQEVQQQPQQQPQQQVGPPSPELRGDRDGLQADVVFDLGLNGLFDRGRSPDPCGARGQNVDDHRILGLTDPPPEHICWGQQLGDCQALYHH